MEVIIKTLNPKELFEFISNDAYDTLAVVPISKHRAISHINNPRVDPEDTIMILAYIDDVMVGYLGVFADRLHFENEISKAGWLSCMWVNPITRGKGVAKKLLQTALNDWNQKILVTEFTVPAKGLYDRSKAFQDLQIRTGVRVFLRYSLHQVLPPKKEIFQHLKPLLKLADASANLLIVPFQSKPNNKPEVNYEICDQIDSQIETFINHRLSQQLIRRDATDLKWILTHPWVIPGSDINNYKERYEFSAIDDFTFIPVKVFDQEHKMIGFILLSKRNGHVKIPYAYFDDNHINNIVELIAYFAKKWQVNMLSCFHPLLSKVILKEAFPGIHKREIRRHYIVSKVFETQLKDLNIVLQDGDADCVFT